LREKGSLRKIAPENPVRIGVMNVNTVASDKDRYWREKYSPERPTKLRMTWTEKWKCSKDHVGHGPCETSEY